MIDTLFRLAMIATCIIGVNINAVEAQSRRFTNGYLVKNTGDTVSGYIQKWERDRFPKAIKFKKTLEAEPVVIDPLTTKFFSLDNQIYESHILILDKSAYARNKLYVNHLPYDNKRILVKDTVFLNVMVKGKVDLLYLYDEKPHFFLRSDAFEIDELINHQYKKQLESNGKTKTVVIESKRYFGQLGYYLSDCKNIQKKIQKTRLLPEDLVNLIDEYNSCN